MRKISMMLVAAAGFALAALTGLAIGKGGHTLAVQQGVKNVRLANKLETVVVNPHGLALYYLSGESKTNPLCTKAKGCFPIWKPFKFSSKVKLSAAPGVTGKLGFWHRDGFFQVTLAGHPLYRFKTDTKGLANGDTIASFGGTWHLIIAGSSGGSGTTTSSTGPTTTTGTTTTGTTTTTCLYPPCY